MKVDFSEENNFDTKYEYELQWENKYLNGLNFQKFIKIIEGILGNDQNVLFNTDEKIHLSIVEGFERFIERTLRKTSAEKNCNSMLIKNVGIKLCYPYYGSTNISIVNQT